MQKDEQKQITEEVGDDSESEEDDESEPEVPFTDKSVTNDVIELGGEGSNPNPSAGNAEEANLLSPRLRNDSVNPSSLGKKLANQGVCKDLSFQIVSFPATHACYLFLPPPSPI